VALKYPNESSYSAMNSHCYSEQDMESTQFLKATNWSTKGTKLELKKLETFNEPDEILRSNTRSFYSRTDQTTSRNVNSPE